MLRKQNSKLLMENWFKKDRGLLCQGKRVRFKFVADYKKTFPNRVTCKAMGVNPSAFYLLLSSRALHNKDVALGLASQNQNHDR